MSQILSQNRCQSINKHVKYGQLGNAESVLCDALSAASHLAFVGFSHLEAETYGTEGLEAVFPGPEGRITLQEWIESHAIVWPLQLRYAKDLIRGLLFASKRIPGFVHGDLKPSNLLIDVCAGYRLKITDFGLSRAVGLEIPETLSDLGTRMYMAPECWSTKRFTSESDVYAFGLILYEIIAGRHPLADITDMCEIEQRHRGGFGVQEFNVPGGKEIGQLVRRCLSVDPSARPSILKIADELGITTDEPQVEQDRWKALELNNKATGLIGIGNHRDAIPLLTHAVQLEPEIAAGWTNLAVALSNCGKVKEAEATYQQCFRMENVPAEAYAAYAAHLMRLGTNQAALDAVEACEKAIELKDSCMRAWINKASALNSIGKYEEALNAAATARKLDPAQPHALFELAFAYMKLGRRKHARKMVEKALAISPTFQPARVLKKQIREMK